MLFGATNNPLRPVTDEIKILAGLGFDYLEICIDPPMALPEKIREERGAIESVLSDTGMKLAVAHLPTFVWLADIYEGIREASITEVESALAICSELGIKKAVLHPGYLTGLLAFIPGAGPKLSNQSLERILEAAGNRNIVICLENMFPRAGHMYKPDEFVKVMELYPELMMTFDIGHANIQVPRETGLEFVDKAGPRIKHVHVSDNTGKEDEHLPLGAGRVDIAGGLAALKEAGYDDTLTLEVFSQDRSYLSMSLSKVRTMWEKL